MADETREANVVLTADTSGYDQSIQQSADTTGTLVNSIDSLTKKLGDLSRSAGRKLQIFAAADVAAITAATAAYASYEHQLAGLNAQAAVLGTTMNNQRQNFANYESAVTKLRTAFPTTTAEAANLVSVLSKMGTVAPGQIQKMATVFMQASGATGESATGLASSILGLQQVMGSDVRNVDKYTDSIVTLASKSNTSAQGLAEFASNIAPIGRIAGMTQTQVLGVSAAFAKSGQDGYTAANAFNKMLTDITYAAQSGSPDLLKYSNLIGVTADQFKSMDKSQAVVQIFDSLNKMGPQAITTLNRMGLDGMRTMRAITAVTQTSGGLGASIRESEQAYGSGATQKGAEAAFGGLASSMSKLGEQVKMSAEEIGSTFAPVMDKFVQGMTKGMQAVNAFLAGPAGKLLQWAVAAAAPLAAVAGTVLSMAGPIAAFAGAATLIRNPMRFGAQDAYAAARGGGKMSPMGAAMAAGSSNANFLQRWMYGVGGFGGGAAGTMMGEREADTRSLWQRMRGTGAPTSLASRLASLPLHGIGLGAGLISGSLSAGTIPGFRDPGEREKLFQKARLRDYFGAADILKEQGAEKTAPLRAYGASVLAGMGFKKYGEEGGQAPEKVLKGMDDVTQQQKKLSEETGRLGSSFKNIGKESMTFSAGLKSASSGLGGLLKTMTSNVAMMGGAGLGMAGKGLGKLSGALGMSPLGLGMMGATAGFMVYDQFFKDKSQPKLDAGQATPMQEYYKQLGLAGLETQPVATTGVGFKVGTDTKMADAMKISTDERIDAARSNYEYQSKQIESYDSDQYDSFVTDMKGQFSAAPPSSMAPEAIQKLLQDVQAKFGYTRAQEFIGVMNKLPKFGMDSYAKSIQDASNSGERKDVITRMTQVAEARTSAAQALGEPALASVKYGDMYNVLTSATKLQGDDLSALEDYVNTTGIFKGTSYDLSAVSTARGVSVGGAKGGRAVPLAPLTADEIATGLVEGMKGTDLMDLKTDLQSYGVTQESSTADIVKAIGKAADDGKDVSLNILKTQATATDNIVIGTRLQKEFQGKVLHEAELHPEDPSLQYRAVRQLMGQTRGLTAAGRGGAFQEILSTDLSPDSQAYVIAQAAQARQMQQIQTRGVFRGNTWTFEQTMQVLASQRAQMQQGGISPTEAPLMETNRQDTVQAMLDQYSKIKNLALQTREFNVSSDRAQVDFQQQQGYMQHDYELGRERAQQAYDIQRKQQEFDFQLSRQRAEEDYNRSRARAQQNFDIQRRRAVSDFNRSQNQAEHDFRMQQNRAERDYNHQKVLMFESSAKSMYDIYQRVTVQPTISADTLMQNTTEQLQDMRQQSKDLESLRSMGLSNKAINQLGLNDPKNAQQLERFLSDVMENPALVQQFNKQVGKRINAAKGLVTDEASTEWTEFTRQYRVARQRGEHDFEMQMQRSRASFNRQLQRQDTDFDRMMRQQAADFARQMDQGLQDYNRMVRRQNNQFALSMAQQATDFETSTERMNTAYKTSMNRAAHDLNRASTDITGNFNTVARKAMQLLHGQAREQLQGVLDTFDDMYLKTGNKTDKQIQMLERKFGVRFPTTGVGINASPGGGGGMMGRPGSSAGGGAGATGTPAGGGFSPASLTSQTAHRMGPMDSRQTDSGQSATGVSYRGAVHQVFNPMGAGYVDVESNYGNAGNLWSSGFHTGEDMPAAIGHAIFAALDGRVVSTGWNSAYGNLTKLAHGRNLETWYAHQSAQMVSPGDSVKGGQRIGSVGDTGNTTGPHLHFEYRINGSPVNPAQLLSSISGVRYTGAGEGDQTSDGVKFNVQRFLNQQYPELEALSTNIMSGMEKGAWSHKINQMAIMGLRKLARKRGTTMMDMITGTGATAQPGQTPAGVVYGANAHGVWSALIAAGFSKEQAAGIMGNMQSESNFDPFIVQGGGHSMDPASAGSGGYGLVQWTPGSKLVSYLHGRDPSVATEVNALSAQLAGRGSSPETSAGAAIRNARTVKAATLAFELMYERHAGPPQPQRLSQAEAIHDRFAAAGGIFSGPHRVVVGEHGPETVLPLNDRGADFLLSMMRRMGAGPEGRGVHMQGHTRPMTNHTTNYYQIDKSNKFTGAIHVTASSPTSFIQALREQQRHGALGQPLLNSAA